MNILIAGAFGHLGTQLTKAAVAAGHRVTAAVRYVPGFLFDLLALIARISGNGKYANILFGKWTLSHDMVAGLAYGKRSFKAYVQSLYPREA
jgi:nucleoside-diphosphate-sugar epimerase